MALQISIKMERQSEKKRKKESKEKPSYKNWTHILFVRYGDIIKALVKISLTRDKKEECSEASALKNAIQLLQAKDSFDGV